MFHKITVILVVNNHWFEWDGVVDQQYLFLFTLSLDLHMTTFDEGI